MIGFCPINKLLKRVPTFLSPVWFHTSLPSLSFPQPPLAKYYLPRLCDADPDSWD
jgi:hypothetical protein